jgi:hypothetical protein
VLDERARHDLYGAITELLGSQRADTLMALLPPVGWADVATKDDLLQLEARLDVRLDTRFARHEARLDVRLEAIDARFARVDARMAQVEAQVERSFREQTRTMLLALVGAVATSTSLCLGAVALAG